MKYGIQYYYSASKNSTGYCKEAHGDNMPSDCVPITDAMWQIYEGGIKLGLVIQPNSTKDGFVMGHPDSLLSQQELEERAKQQRLTQAKSLLNQSIKLESGVYQRRMSETEQIEFIQWQDALLEFINDERTEIPPTPEFINTFLGA